MGEGRNLLGHASTINIKTISQPPVALLTLRKIYQHGNCFFLYLTILNAVCYQTGIFLFFQRAWWRERKVQVSHQNRDCLIESTMKAFGRNTSKLQKRILQLIYLPAFQPNRSLFPSFLLSHLEISIFSPLPLLY